MHKCMDALYKILREHLPPNCSIIRSKKGEGKCDIVIDNNTYIEGKNEVGAKGADSFPEVISYYANSISSGLSKLCPIPAILIELIGTHLIISGAVYCDAYCVDRLAPPLWLVLQTQNQPVMDETARVLAALKKGIQSLKSYYCQLPATDSPKFPAHTSFKSGITTKKIMYEQEMKRHIFQGTVDGEKVVVKFCHAYSEDAHRLVADIGCAPRLDCCVQPIQDGGHGVCGRRRPWKLPTQRN